MEPLLPGVDGRGRPWRDHRQVINGVPWRLRTGAPWRDLPERYGPWQTVYERFARREADGTWATLPEQVQAREDSAGTVERTVPVGTVDRAHRHAAGAREKGRGPEDEWEDPARLAGRQALGRSRGGLTTRARLTCDGRGLPPAILITPGNVNDRTVFDALLDAQRAPRAGAGRPRRRPDAVIADKACSPRAVRQALRCRGIRAVTPERADRMANRVRRGKAGGRPPNFDREPYKDRNVVERRFSRLEQFRAVATRFGKLAARYRAGLLPATLAPWLREPIRRHSPDRARPRPPVLADDHK
ncbi:IS5 family transposase [Streptomyces sp. NPDC058632]|uniref:IS5 family transposase n=1 Tax=Streptomyces sp. NPDC058632 TaxID=3346567 RepID=UPI00364957AB